MIVILLGGLINSEKGKEVKSRNGRNVDEGGPRGALKELPTELMVDQSLRENVDANEPGYFLRSQMFNQHRLFLLSHTECAHVVYHNANVIGG